LIEVGADDLPCGVDALREDVGAAGDTARVTAESRAGRTAATRPGLARDARRVAQALIDRADELLLQHDEHEDRSADRGDRHGRGGHERDAQ
jgi:hypothetical protein